MYSQVCYAVAMDNDQLRFMYKVSKQANGCWKWLPPLNKRGYPVFRLKGKTVRAHRLAFSWWSGEVLDDELTLDHRKDVCSGPACVNPDHMEQVTRSENTHRQSGSTEDLCRYGHKRDTDNWTTKNRCKTCERIKMRVKRRTGSAADFFNRALPHEKV